MHAQRLAKAMQKTDMPLYYIATMIPSDSEDDSRILRHMQEREGCGFETVEAGRNVLNAIEFCESGGSFLLDSATALLANEMFPRGENIDTNAYLRVANDVLTLVCRLENIVIVSDYIYSDAFVYDELTERYRFGLAYIDRQVAKACDVVLEACYGNLIAHKGKEVFGEIYGNALYYGLCDVTRHVFGNTCSEKQLER